MKRFSRVVLLSAVILIFAAASVHAGGLWLYEEATPDMYCVGPGTFRYVGSGVHPKR